jgi:hypothetical protein
MDDPHSSDHKQDWRDKQLRRKHAKLHALKRENEELRRILKQRGITIPVLERVVEPK